MRTLLAIIIFCLSSVIVSAQLVPISITELEAPKERIVSYREFDKTFENEEGDIVIVTDDKGNIVKEVVYGYREELPLRRVKNEIHRTKYSYLVDNGNYFTSVTYPRQKFHKENRNWYNVKYATTDLETFERETRVVWWESLFVKNAYAVDIDAGAGDGYVERLKSETWSATRSNENGTSSDDSSTIVILRNKITGGKKHLSRAIFPFNTREIIPASADIISASLTLEQIAENTSGSYRNAYVVQASQPDETELTNGDYDAFDALDNPDEGGNRLGTNSTGTKVSTFNSTGLGWIKKNGEASNGGGSLGWTKIMLRAELDIINLNPTTSRRIIATYDSSTGTTPPFLTVNFTWSPIIKNGTIRGGTV